MVATSVLGAQDSEDAFDRKLRESAEGMVEALAKLDYAFDKIIHAGAGRIDQGDLDAYRAAQSEFDERRRTLAPSNLDMWEARQRLVDHIYASDDETVLSLYLTAIVSKQRGKETLEEADRILAQIARNRHRRAAQGVSLTPAPER